MKFKLKSFLAISSLALMSLNVAAYEGKNFRIISEKETHSPNSMGAFISKPIKTFYRPAYVNAMAWAYSTEGRPYEYIRIRGDHTLSLSNDTSATQRYTYTYSLSCESVYENFERTVEIYPHGNFSDNSSSSGVFQPTSEGTYGIHVLTSVTGAENRTHTADAIVRVR